ncbi:hypothetical protein EJF18_10184 [Clavispora lusitaniae]|uniref:Membrane anchor Opy2 N-terminal domain-containing protein n=2 Tax=Clavispora lusitaniae TaxID=36911 RepID=C4XW46_CLAL4|nr:uncharacterized protein CLUG_00169 [Clavispora lusitaniae ATCC 42720]KAF5213409.1 hypothetical protein E0198_000930 [Clavispora lusitaniae]EEQ36046.1 hypothetical protein CLUG_00169 [Clavispora lusitaniae ATCC 42720]QFZ25099.1 hypothetical protein EJF14_10184 [Clavispora lusitaniae]QFZ31598.1 hypothetical protein EJF16_10184 [Clavispora lusitaniae]QFZ37266.1 hypothetical protein EJF15_10184 [Clavispora lusitaniae]
MSYISTPASSLTLTSTLPLELYPRADSPTPTQADETDASGNLVCPTEVSCPSCPPGQECYQRARTPTSCAQYVCVNSSSNSGSKVSIGGIVGGVVGGVAVAALVSFFLYYKYLYLPKRKRHADLALGDIDAADGEHKFEDSPSAAERPPMTKSDSSVSVPKNHRLSAYDSFMRPQARYASRTHSSGSVPRQNGANSHASASVSGGAISANTTNAGHEYANSDLAKRASIATTISTTNASNILPVAYIPGVTIRPSKNNTRSIYSYESDSIFSDFNAIDGASIVADRNGPPAKGTMTAIKAQPRLVNVARIEEGDENEMADEGKTWPHEESEPDSDVDSDIGEIHRATSTRHPPPASEES